jgi:single-strand DNA-binding protein
MYSKITLIGRLGKDPEMKYTSTAEPVTNFNVATNYTYVNKNGEKVDKTTWWRVSVFGKQAEACNTYLAKGSLVLVEGRMTPDDKTGGPRVWQSDDGLSHAMYEMVATDVRFLSKSEAKTAVVSQEEMAFD